MGNRCVCYCDDCQSFAHALGRANEIVDANGGTEIFQTFPRRIEFTHGRSEIACLRLSESGMFRWYAGCCNTPIGNTPSTNRVLFVGLIHSCMSEVAVDGRARDEVLGPIRMRGFARFAKGDPGPLDAVDTVEGIPLAMGERVTALIAEGMAAGTADGEAGFGAFFDAQSGEPIALPRVLSSVELLAVERARDEA